MDGIKPGQINFARNAAHVGAAQTEGKDKKAEKKQEGPKDQVTLQSLLKFKSSDVNEAGRVGVIIKAKDPEKLAALREKVLENPENKIKVDLPLISGFAAELAPNSRGILPELGKSTSDIRVFLDQQVHLIEPVEKFDNDAHIMMDVAAGTAAGDGKSSEGKYAGAAPEASLVGIKVLNKYGSGSFSDVIAGIQWATEQKDEMGIDIISMSLGGYASESYKDDPVAQAVEAAVGKGIITCIAAGNSGPSGQSIGTPATAPHVISVGALDDQGTIEREDDKLAYFSSRGPTRVDGLPKPDILTPGVRITAPKNTGGYTTMSGTSMACPLAAGMAALIKSAAPTVTPGELKGVVMGSADDLKDADGVKMSHNDQGAGVFDVAEAIEKLTGVEIIPPPPPPPPPEQTPPQQAPPQ